MDITYATAKANVPALKALGLTRIYLYGDVEPPWHIANKCKEGCTMRLGVSTSVNFEGVEEGITYCWSIDIEPFSANGTGTTRIDVDGIEHALAKLKGDAREGLRKHLATLVGAVNKQGDEYRSAADRQYRDAAILRDIVKA